MKFSMFVIDNAIQFNLTPENEHEKEFANLLNKYKGEVSITNGADIAMSSAGYIRNFSYGTSERIIAVTIRKPEPKPTQEQ